MGLLRAPVTVALQTARKKQKKGKKRFRASLHRPRRTSLGFESQLAPLLAEVRDLVPVGVDSGSSSSRSRRGYRRSARGLLPTILVLVLPPASQHRVLVRAGGPAKCENEAGGAKDA